MPKETQKAPMYPIGEFLKDAWSYVRPYKGRFFFATICRIIGDLSALYPAYAFAEIISFFAKWHPGDSLHPMVVVITIWAVLSAVNALTLWAARHMGYVLAERVAADAFSKGMAHLTALDTQQHEKEGAGIKLKRVQRGRDAIDKIVRTWFMTILEVVVMMGGTLFIVTRIDWLTGIIFAGFALSYLAIGLSFTKKATAAAHHEGEQEEKVQNTSFEIIGNIRTVRSLGVSEYLLKLLNLEIAELYARIKKRIFWFRIQAVSLSTWFRYYKIACFAFIIYGVSRGHFEIGFLVLFNAYFNRVTDVCEELSDVSQDFVLAKNNLWRLQETLRFPTRPGIQAPHEFPYAWQHLHVRDVSFGYYHNQPVLQNINFTIKRGERIGIVGSSGAGKSTIFKLLLKEYDSFHGSITIDETSIQSISEASYFKKVAVVLQDTEVFNLSLRENIITANPEQKDNAELFNHAVEVSHVADFVHKLPQSYETIIGEKGFKLSGGERQRLGIARAIFKKSDLLLLDEATSHLDLESEEEIKDSLHKAFQHITAVVIAHRLTTIKEMDRILVIEDGKIIEEGSFDELQKKRGRFHELWEKQKL